MLAKKKQEKEINEMKSIEESLTTVKINKNSELIVQHKNEIKQIEKMQNQPEEFELWPVQMQKNYFEK